MRQPPETRFFIRTCRKPPSTVPLSLIDLRTTVLSLPLDFIHVKCYFLFVFYGDRKSSRLSQQKKHHRDRSSGLSNPLQKSPSQSKEFNLNLPLLLIHSCLSKFDILVGLLHHFIEN